MVGLASDQSVVHVITEKTVCWEVAAACHARKLLGRVPRDRRKDRSVQKTS